MRTEQLRGCTVADVGPNYVSLANSKRASTGLPRSGAAESLLTHSILKDLAIAIFAGLSAGVSRSATSSVTESWVYWGIVAGCCATLLLRSRMPGVSLTVLAILMLLHLFVLQELTVFAVTICIVAAYSTQTRLAPPWRWIVLAMVYTGTAAAIFLSKSPITGPLWPNRAEIASWAAAGITIAALVGFIRRQNRDRTALAIERTAFLESQQEMMQRLAASRERARIAREMHDILGHSLNTIAVLAEGARYSVRSDADRAERALADIGRLSRKAVDEVHELIDVLRTEDEPSPKHPTPNLNDLAALVDSVLGNNTVVSLDTSGDLSRVPPVVSRAAYRIIQEALTNSIKHANPALIEILVNVGVAQVEMNISNDCSGNPSALTGVVEGHGITGMRERAEALGGRINVGSDPSTDRWRVSATLPWD